MRKMPAFLPIFEENPPFQPVAYATQWVRKAMIPFTGLLMESWLWYPGSPHKEGKKYDL